MTAGRTVLVIDDDQRLRDLLSEYLSGRGFTVVTAEDGTRGFDRARQGGVDLVVLDLTLPDQDGLEVCRRLRATSDLPVIMLTARGEDTDRIVGLELGADDYLAKPFNPRELVARIDAVLRRGEARPTRDAPLRAGRISVDVSSRLVRLDGAVVELTTTEFELLRVLVAGAGRVIPRERLMGAARGEDWAAYDRSVDVHISHLRRKLGDDPRAPSLIKTVRGVGYTVAVGGSE